MNNTKHSHIFSEQLQGSEGIFRTSIPMSNPSANAPIVTWARYRIAIPNETNRNATVSFFLKTWNGVVPFSMPEQATLFHWMPLYWILPSVNLVDSEILMEIDVHDTSITSINLKLMGFDNILRLDNQYVLHGKHGVRNWMITQSFNGFIIEEGLEGQRTAATHIYFDS
jgi:hypothetical protein